MSYFITKCYNDGSTTTSLHSPDNSGESELTSNDAGFCVSFEVSKEMGSQTSFFSQCKSPCVFGTNFVVDSFIPQFLQRKQEKIDGIKKLKKVRTG